MITETFESSAVQFSSIGLGIAQSRVSALLFVLMVATVAVFYIA
jgi:hypothetical protein